MTVRDRIAEIQKELRDGALTPDLARESLVVLTALLCFAEYPAHGPSCPLMTLRVQVQELGAQLGLYVATMRELLDTVDALLRGDTGRP